ncbi:28S ribosomal protein S15, mitochondrial [Strongylocentrotus purpuratus]|uniref:Small ribosomal subunit protein uS15m n=1 Tax=Strongylocentrotus purpuratus TaxID=7668 RepID=A0A7M7RB11_STRPU|nr:28S ribosomal protein S15, mitochondrial [Strongylocentrotus purpuratus]
MAVADITAHLRRTIISFRNTKRFDTICRINQVRAVSTSLAMSNSAASGRSGHQVGDRAPSSTSMLPRSPMHFSRGLASRAHMKYNKRKKEPVDRFGGLDPAQPRLGFEKVKELETANENVKKLFSLDFGTGNDLHNMRRKLSQDFVRDKPDEKDDLAVKIATITEHIRALAPHVENNKKDSVNKVRMLNAIDRRRKMLKYLRKRNYERFERLLVELNLTWTPPPEFYRRKTRRSMEKKATVQEAYAKRTLALKEFETRWRQEQLLEIAHLKEELGKELTEEEQGLLTKSREETTV